MRFGTRDYDASIGRWTSKDPLAFEANVSNFYEYVLNDPINYVDLDGLQRATISWLKDFMNSANESLTTYNNLDKGNELANFYLRINESEFNKFQVQFDKIKTLMDIAGEITGKNIRTSIPILNFIREMIKKEKKRFENAKCQNNRKSKSNYQYYDDPTDDWYFKGMNE